MPAKKIFLFILLVIWCILMMLKVYIEVGKSFNGIDDANIYMVYMKNFANGHGFVYNVGGERVEGFTSILWTLVGSLFYLISAKGNILLLAANILLIAYVHYRLVVYIFENIPIKNIRNLSIFFLLFLLMSVSGYYEWVILALLETSVWSALLIFLTLYTLAERNQNYPSITYIVLLLLLVFTRPESMLWGTYFIALRVAFYISKEKKLRNQTIFFLKFFVPFLTAVLLLVYWRISYFGYPFPNTYYAKISSNLIYNIQGGIAYDIQYFKQSPVSIVIICFILLTVFISFLHKRDVRIDLITFLSLFIFALIPPLLTGGDHFSYSRFIQPVIPLLWLSFGFSIYQFTLLNGRSIILKSFTCLIIVISLLDPVRIYIRKHKPLKNEFELAKYGREQSLKLNVFFNKMQSLPTQGVLTAGGTAYSYKGITIDLLGLNNVEMAHANKYKNQSALRDHASFDKKIFFKQKPELFFYGAGFSTDSMPRITLGTMESAIFQNIQLDTLFLKKYSAVVLEKKGFPEFLKVYASNEFLNKLDTAFYKVKRL